MVSAAETLAVLQRCNALFEGHFVGTQERPVKGTGFHMQRYVDFREVLTYPIAVATLAEGIAFDLHQLSIDVVVGFPLGSYTLAHEVAKNLGARYVAAERTSGGLAIQRPAFVKVLPDARVAVIEDTLVGGTTVTQGVEAVHSCTDSAGHRLNARVVVVGCVTDRRGPDSQPFGIPVHALLQPADMPTYTREECLAARMCSLGVPIDTRLGHGAKLRELYQNGYFTGDPHYTFV